MADVEIATDFRYVYHNNILIPHHTDPSIVYFIYIDRDDSDLKYKKSTDHGATWGAQVTIRTGSVIGVSCWPDWYTPGDTGTLINIAYTDDGVDDVFYRTLDVASDTLGTERTIYAGVTITSGVCPITKARNGYLYCAFRETSTTGQFFYRSTDAGVNWASRTTIWENADDAATIYPASNTGDNADIWAIFLDASASEISLKVYDDSANTVTETSIATSITYNGNLFQFAAACRHSDGHLILAYMNLTDNAAGDMYTWDINGAASIVAKTNIFTNIDDTGGAAVFIDQNSDDIYVSWIGKPDGLQTFNTSIDIYYSRSDDGGTTWNTEVRYSETTGNMQVILGAQGGARFIVGWMADAGVFDYRFRTNRVNSVAFYSLSLTGNQPNATGATTRISIAFRSAAGNQPNATGTLSVIMRYVRALVGNQPSSTGLAEVTRSILTRLLEGNQPTSTGILARLLSTRRDLTGNQPAASGTVSRILALYRSLDGSQPAASGVVSFSITFVRSAAGNQPASSGVLTFNIIVPIKLQALYAATIKVISHLASTLQRHTQVHSTTANLAHLYGVVEVEVVYDSVIVIEASLQDR